MVDERGMVVLRFGFGLVWFYFLFVCFGFFETGFHCVALPVLELCRPGWLRIHRDPSVSATRFLGLMVCVTEPGHVEVLNFNETVDFFKI